MTTDNLSKIIAKIRALRARAADAASTEAEAAIATRMAAKLLAEHNINLTELDVRAEGVSRQDWESGQRTRPVEAYVLHGINALCNVRSWYQGGRISLVGAPADVETALYFLDLARNACQSCWTAHYRNMPPVANARSYGSAFRIGVAVRLGERMKELARNDRGVEIGSTSRALVPVKDALIQTWLAQNNIKLGSRSGGRDIDRSGYGAGRAAGDGVSLARGVGFARSGRLALR